MLRSSLLAITYVNAHFSAVVIVGLCLELEDEEENESDGEEAVSVNSYNSGRGSLLRFDALELEPSEGSIDCDGEIRLRDACTSFSYVIDA